MIAALVALTMALGVSSASEPIVACFSDDGTQGQFSVWIYEGHTDWQIAQDDPHGTLMFGFRPGKKKLRTAQLDYCRYLVDPATRETSDCDSGSLEILEFFPPERISLRYSFTLENGTQKAGDLRASYCPRGRK